MTTTACVVIITECCSFVAGNINIDANSITRKPYRSLTLTYFCTGHLVSYRNAPMQPIASESAYLNADFTFRMRAHINVSELQLAILAMNDMAITRIKTTIALEYL